MVTKVTISLCKLAITPKMVTGSYKICGQKIVRTFWLVLTEVVCIFRNAHEHYGSVIDKNYLRARKTECAK